MTQPFKLGFAPPRIPYLRCMRSFFVLGGTVYSVEMCSKETFLEFVLGCPKRKGQERINQSSIVKMMEEDDGLARWYILDAMLEHHYIVPLYDNAEGAMDSQIGYNEDRCTDVHTR